MNERIKELAEQAEDYADGIVDQGGEFHPAYTEKFAELIVKECAKLIRDGDYSHTADPIFEASCDIEEHFRS